MHAILAAMAVDLGVRCDAIELAIGASDQPELAFQRSIAERDVAGVRQLIPSAVAGSGRVDPPHYGAHLRRLQALSRILDRVEWRILPCLARFTQADTQQTRMLSTLLEEAGWSAWQPAVLTWSTSYFSAAADLHLINVCAGEERRLLRLPDMAHEFGHCLYDTEDDYPTKSLLGDLLLWSSEAIDAAQAEFRDRVVSLWSDAWLAEFTCDAVGTFLVGPAYGKQHLVLTARLDSDPYGHLASHPADHARAALIAHVLRVLGLPHEADLFWSRWGELCEALEQPVVDRDLGDPAVKGEFFWSFYPTDGAGEHFIDKVARLAVEGCRSLRMVPYAPGRSDRTVTGLLDAAWAQYENDPAGYAADEPRLVEQLLASLS